MKKRTGSFLLTCAAVLCLLSSGLFSVTAEAAALYTYTPLPAADFSYTVTAGPDGKKYTDDDCLTVKSYTGAATAVQIPDTAPVSVLPADDQAKYTTAGVAATTQLKVTAVGRYFLDSCTNRSAIVGVRLGANITEIIEGAFAGGATSVLKEVEFPANSAVTSFGEYAFRNRTLERAGVDGSNKMPAALKSVSQYCFDDTYALKSIDFSLCTKLYGMGTCCFADSGITSIVTPPNLKYLDMNAFEGCEGLTTITLSQYLSDTVSKLEGETKESSGYFGPRCFENCKSLTSVTFEGGIPSSGWAALKGVSAACVVNAPKPATDAAYASYVNTLYGTMQANAGVKLRWTGSSNGQAVPTPSGNLITLSGADAGSYTLTYDVTDADKDGVGGVLVITGRQNVASPLTLNLNANGCGNTTYAVWGKQKAYGSQREGTVNGEMLFGTDLAAMMGRTQQLGFTPKAADQTKTPAISLKISFATNSLGAYYYTPMLVNAGTKDTPQTAKALPAVLVIYQPGSGDSDRLSATMASTSATSYKDISGPTITAAEAATLNVGPTAYNMVYCSGFESVYPAGTTLVKDFTFAELDGGATAIAYTWNWRKADGTLTRVTDGYARFGGYENAAPNGVQWKIPGIAQAWFIGKSTGSYTFVLTVEVKVNNVVQTTLTSADQTIHIYNTIRQTGWDVNAAEAGTGNWFTDADHDGSSYRTPALMKQGTRNVTLTPVDNIAAMGLDGYATYEWLYDIGGGPSAVMSGTGPAFLSEWLPDTPGMYHIGCKITLFSATGDKIGSYSYSPNYYSVQVTDQTAVYSDKTPVFNEDAMRVVYFSNHPFYEEEKYIYVPATNLNRVDRVEVYEAPDRTSNRGGTPRGSATGAGLHVVPDAGGGGAWLSVPNVSFPDYQARWCYLKLTLHASYGGGVVYSPVFAALPDENYVPATAVKPRAAVRITSAPPAEVYLANNAWGDLTYGLKLTNIPMMSSTYDASGPICGWEFLSVANEHQWFTMNIADGSDDYYAHAAFQPDTVDIVAGELVLEGTATFSTKYYSSVDEKYFAGDDGDEKTELKTRLVVTDAYHTDAAHNWEYDTVATSSETTLRLSNFMPAVNDAYINDTGGKMKWVHGTGANNVPFARYDPDTSLAPGSYRLFSDSYDKRNSTYELNQPASAPFTSTVTAGRGSGVLFTADIRWHVYDGETGAELAVLTQENPSYTYASGAAYTIGEYAFDAYTDTITVSYVGDGKPELVSTLTVNAPGGQGRNLFQIVPEAMLWTKGGDIKSAATLLPRTVTLNPASSTAAPYSPPAESVLLSSKRVDEAATADTVVYTINSSARASDGGNVTARWYQSRQSTLRGLDGSCTALGPELDLGAGGGSLSLKLTKAMCQEIYADGAGGPMYYYLYITNTNPYASTAWTVTKLNRAATVTVGSFPSVAVPELTAHSGAADVSVLYGQQPEDPGILSLTTGAAPADTRRTVRVVRTITSTITDQVVYNDTFTVGLWDKGEAPAGNNGTVRANADGTYTWTVNARTVGVGLTETVKYSNNETNYTSGSLKTTFRWEVEDLYAGELEMAVGGQSASARSGTYTITQLCPDAMDITDLTMSPSASDNNTLTVNVPAAMPAHFGASSTVPAFRQLGTYTRPFTFGLTAPAVAGLGDYGGVVQVEYWAGDYLGWQTAGRLTQTNADTKPPWKRDSATVYPNGAAFSATLSDYIKSDGEYAYPAFTTTDSSGKSVNVVFLRVSAKTRLAADGSELYGTPARQVFALARLPQETTPVHAMAPVQVQKPVDSYVLDQDADPCALTLQLGSYAKAQGDPSTETLTYRLYDYTGGLKGRLLASGQYPDPTVQQYTLTDQLLTDACAQAKESGAKKTLRLLLEAVNTDTRPAVTGNQEAVKPTVISIDVGKPSKPPVVQLQNAAGDVLTTGAEITLRKNDTTPTTLTAVVTNRAALGESVSLSYLWLSSQDSGETWNEAYGTANQSAYQLYTGYDSDRIYYCRVKSTDPDATVSTTHTVETIQVTVKTEKPAAPTGVSITATDQQKSLHQYGKTTLPCAYASPGPDTTLQFQWVKSADSTIDFAADTQMWSNYISDSGVLTVGYYDFPDGVTELYFGLRVRAARFNAYSDWVTVSGSVKVTLLDANAPTLTTVSPASQTLQAGNTVTLEVSATSGNAFGDQPYGTMYYSWYYSDTIDGTKRDLAFDSLQPTVTPSSMSGGGTRYYWAKARERSATNSSWTPYSGWVSFTVTYQGSDAVAPYMERVTPQFSYSDTDPSLALTGAATSTDGGTISYQWQRYASGSWEDIPDATAATLSDAAYPTAPGYAQYRLVATNTRTAAPGEKTASASIDFYLVRRGFVVTSLPTLPANMMSGQTMETQSGTIYWYGEDSTTENLGLTLKNGGGWLTLDPGYTNYETGLRRYQNFTLDGTANASVSGAQLTASVTLGDKTTTKDFSLGSITVSDFALESSKITVGVMDGAGVSGRLTAQKLAGGVRTDTTGTFAVTGGALPDWLTLNADGSFALASGHTVGDPGRYPVSVTFTETGTGKTLTTDVEVLVKSASSTPYTVYLYDAEGNTIRVRDNPTGTGYSYDKDTGVLTLTNFTGSGMHFDSTVCIKLVGANTLTKTIADSSYLISGSYDVHLTGNGSLTATATVTSNSYTGATNAGVTLRESFTGQLALTGSVNGSNRFYGVKGSLVQRSAGTVAVTVTQTGGTSNWLSGVYGTLDVCGGGKVTVSVDGDGKASSVYGVYDNISTAGTVDVSVTAQNGASSTWGVYDYEATLLNHTGGAVAVSAPSGANAQAIRYQPANDPLYKVTGAWNSGYVKYDVPTNAAPVFQVDGTEQTALTLSLSQGLPMTGKSIRAYCVDGCSIAVQAGALPAGVSYNADTRLLSGTPTASGNGTATLRAASKTDSTKYTDFVVTWNVSDISLHLGYHNGNRFLYDPDNGIVHVGKGGSVYAFTLGQAAASYELTSDDPDKLTCKTYNGGFSSIPDFYSADGDSSRTATPADYLDIFTIIPTETMAVDDEVTVTLTAKDSGGNAIATETFTVKLANGAAVEYLRVGNNNYAGTRYTDYNYIGTDGNGWSWNHKTGVLTLKNFSVDAIDGYGDDDAPFIVEYSGSNQITRNISAYGTATPLVLRATAADALLSINSTYSSGAVYAGALTVEGPGRFVVEASTLALRTDATGKVIPLTIGKDVRELRITGPFNGCTLNPTVATDAPAGYLYNNGTNAFYYGTSAPEPEVTVTGGSAVAVGGSTTLTAQLPAWLAGAKRSNDPATAAFAITYQWEHTMPGGDIMEMMDGETSPTLTVTAADVAAGGTERQYRCTAYVALTGTGSTNLAASAAHTVALTTVEVKVSGTLSSSQQAAVDGVTLTLTKQGDELPLYTTTAGAATGSYTSAYSFDTVLGGYTYILKVVKGGTAMYSKSITVGVESLTVDITLNLLGDVNDNGRVNAVDVMWIYQYTLGQRTLTDAQIAAADVDGSGTINAVDILLIRQRLQGILDENYNTVD